jgi:hypothetical protein
MRRLLLVALCGLVVIGCANGPTSVLVELSYGDTGKSTNAVTVSAYDVHGAIVLDRQLTSVQLPGSLILSGLSDANQTLRVVVRGDGADEPVRGGERIETRAHQQVRLAIALHAARLDSDGDGVPDDLDDCPIVFDPPQLDTDGNGQGDACSPVDQGMVVVVVPDGSAGDDLSVEPPDLRPPPPPADLSGADLKGVDLSPPPDLAPPGSSCPLAGVLFCEGFESGTLNANWTKMLIPAATSTVTVDSTFAYRGNRSMKVHVGAIVSNGDARAEIQDPTHYPTTTFSMRVWAFVPSSTPASLTRMMGVSQSTSPYLGHGLAHDQAGKLYTENSTLPPSYNPRSSATAMPRDRWTCLEWEIVAGTPTVANGSVRLYVDDAIVNDLTTTNVVTQPGTPLGLFLLGLSTFASPTALTARDAWFDELIIDTNHIGCAK